MKISRWKLIKALKKRLIPSVFNNLVIVGLICGGVFIVSKIVGMAIDGRDMVRFFKKTWLTWVMMAGVWSVMLYSCFQVPGGYILDILLLRIEKLTEIPRGAIALAGMKTGDVNYASEYYVHITRGKKEKPLQLYANEELSLLPKGKKYNIYYLKSCKAIVGVEVLEETTAQKEEKIILMDAPEMPQYGKEELKEMTKGHRRRATVLLMYCIGGAAALAVWGIYSAENYVYWYLLEKERCIGIWGFFIVLEVIFIALFRRIERGYFRDLHHREICVTEVLPINSLYGRRLLTDIKNRANGIEIEVKDGIHSKKRFLLYKEFSEYWNCIPMYTNMPVRMKPRFEQGEYKPEAVRIYYLKKSRIVVKLDV